MTQQTNLALKKLKGIKPKGIKIKKDSKLEYLVSLLPKVFDYDFKIRIFWIRAENFFNRYSEHKEYFQSLIPEDLVLTNNLIESFVHSTLDLDINGINQFALGIFSGQLVNRLVDQNKKLNKPTKLYINGQGQEVNNLLNTVDSVDELIIDNFKGQQLGSGFGINSSAGTLAVINCEGYGAANCAAIAKGSADMVLVINCNGGMPVKHAAVHGKGINELVVIDNPIEVLPEQTWISSGHEGLIKRLITYNTSVDINPKFYKKYCDWNSDKDIEERFPKLLEYSKLIKKSNSEQEKIETVRNIRAYLKSIPLRGEYGRKLQNE
ncbi:hypothetical protein HOK51_07975 [Candidatus Woesearchaeota archaeon]|jgi:hypothetical protein|nr:hypothetical protein [Candidatus Woesearchaeota archaeon]MBT6519763.1 hypothetical protein [Candidatus Woesearchaeota archaeon]MBT7368142.1 hypothetical protein [Candidatus Woesearchaeota archaeon]